MFGGFQNLGLPDFSNRGATGEAYLNSDLGNALNAFLQPYQSLYGGSNFWDYLGSSMFRNRAQQAYDLNESNLFGQGLGAETPSYVDFLKTWFNPTQSFYSMAPRDRGENPGAQSPFTRFLTR